MNFIISSTELLKSLIILNRVVPSNPIVPILENFKFEFNKTKLTIHAFDLKTFLIAEVKAELNDIDKNKIAIPAKILLETLKTLPEQPLNFSIDEKTYKINIICNTGEYQISGENGEYFPTPPVDSKKNNHFEIESLLLLKAVNSTSFCIEKKEAFTNRQGLCFNIQPHSVEFAATDGFRISTYKIETVCKATDRILLPTKDVHHLKALLPDNETTVKLEFNASNAFFTYDNIKMICRLIDERFPDYENAIPTNNPNKLTINRTDFLNSLKRISIYANKTTHQVRLKINGSELQISAEDLDFENSAREQLEVEYIGADMEIGMASGLLTEMLSTIDSETVEILLSEPSKPLLVNNANNAKSTMLIMPNLLNACPKPTL